MARTATLSELKTFLEGFPKDAQDWRRAGDEVRTVARSAREILDERQGEGTAQVVDFRTIQTPSEWNTRGREAIEANIARMAPDTLDAFLQDITGLIIPEA